MRGRERQKEVYKEIETAIQAILDNREGGIEKKGECDGVSEEKDGKSETRCESEN